MSFKCNIYKKYALIGIPIILLLYIPLHLLYKYSGNSLIIGLFTPINESSWEWLKLTFYPTLIWWFLGYIFISKKANLNYTNWFVTSTISAIFSSTILLILSFIFTTTLGLNPHFINILSLFIAVFLSQILSIHIYENSSFSVYDIYTAISIMFFLILIFTFFTFIPPHYSIFQDPLTKAYGIII